MTFKSDQAAIDDMFRDPNGPIAKIVEQKAIAVESLAKILVMTPGSGRVYTPGEYFLNRGGKIYHWTMDHTHQASAPGEPPASDTGYLAANISHRMGVDEYVYGEVVANTKYATWLEEGTRFMEPRPFLRPALSAVEKL